MKNIIKITVLILFLFSISINLNSQIKFGVKTGVNYSNIKVKDYNFKTNYKIGYSLGAIISLDKEIGFQSGIMLVSKGWKYDLKNNLEKDITVTGYDKVTILYIDIPLNITYKISDFTVLGGPYFSIPFTGKRKYDYELVNKTTDFHDPYKGNHNYIFMTNAGYDDGGSNYEVINPLDFGLNLGIGYNFKKFQIDVSYSYGLSNLTSGRKYFDRKFLMADRIINLNISYFIKE